jgi:hypothetical protein
MVHGKEHKWKTMQERLKEALLNPNMKFGNSAEKSCSKKQRKRI